MIGLLFFFIAGIWVLVAISISARLPRWLGVTRRTKTASQLLFPMVLVVPIADDLIGRWQFHRLCEREAVVALSPGWEKVKRAVRKDVPPKYIAGYLIPIDSQGGQYFDLDSGAVFMTSQSLFTDGGFLRRHLYGLDGQATYCHPKNIQTIQQQLNLFELLKKGETK